MMNTKVIKFAASTVVIGMMMVGCKPATTMYRPAVASATAAQADQAAAKAYQDAQEALSKGKRDVALTAMEQAVAWSPQDAGYRSGLAEMYLKSGRFTSAEATYADVVTLNPSDNRAGFYLALTRIAQGKTPAAMQQLGQMDTMAAPADIGLAYAIAGDTRRALELLEPAARSPGANGRVRQNLALTYALAGDWKKARIVAAQDLSPADLNNRLAQWAALADPTATASRVATLLNVTVVTDDPGQPARLALAPVAPVSNALAAVEPAPLPVPVEAQPSIATTVAALTPEPVVTPVADSGPPVVQAVYAQAAQELLRPAFAEQQIRPTAIPAFIPARNFSRAAKRNKFVVQLGAFRSATQVERAWAQAQRRFAFGNDQQPLSTTVRVDGLGTMHRLSVSGFSSHETASRVCQSIKARNGVCFVRTIAGDAPVQWASRYNRKA